jgi:diketogulonate reductase-like aldo/keto reductase
MLKTKNKYLYEHLSLIVKAYEEELSKMTSRDAILVMAHSPLAASRELLYGSLEDMQMNY